MGLNQLHGSRCRIRRPLVFCGHGDIPRPKIARHQIERPAVRLLAVGFATTPKRAVHHPVQSITAFDNHLTAPGLSEASPRSWLPGDGVICVSGHCPMVCLCPATQGLTSINLGVTRTSPKGKGAIRRAVRHGRPPRNGAGPLLPSLISGAAPVVEHGSGRDVVLHRVRPA